MHNGKRLLDACELQYQFEQIVQGDYEPSYAEKHVAALTAGDRTHWAKARKVLFFTFYYSLCFIEFPWIWCEQDFVACN